MKNLMQLKSYAKNKENFLKIDDYTSFCKNYLEFIKSGLQAVIVSQNEKNYRFFQYKEDGNFTITRPINSDLMLSIENFDNAYQEFKYALKNIQDIYNDKEARDTINKIVYTCQQSIGAALDALPAGESNFARKINGDLFERFIRILISAIGVDVREGTVKVPVKINGEEQFYMNYQHDLIVEKNGNLKAIGSVKTSSKDRIDKVFIDKFLYNRLTDSNTPHFAVFLNDVQRSGKEPNYKVNSTFLTGHFKGYTVKLSPLDGVYYCDMRPNMITEPILKENIRSLDYLLVEDIWKFSSK